MGNEMSSTKQAGVEILVHLHIRQQRRQVLVDAHACVGGAGGAVRGRRRAPLLPKHHRAPLAGRAAAAQERSRSPCAKSLASGFDLLGREGVGGSTGSGSCLRPGARHGRGCCTK